MEAIWAHGVKSAVRWPELSVLLWLYNFAPVTLRWRQKAWDEWVANADAGSHPCVIQCGQSQGGINWRGCRRRGILEAPQMDWMALDTNWEMQRGQKRRVALFDETRISTNTRSNFASHSFQKTSGKVPCHEAFCFHYIFTAAGLTHTGIIVHSFKG